MNTPLSVDRHGAERLAMTTIIPTLMTTIIPSVRDSISIATPQLLKKVTWVLMLLTASLSLNAATLVTERPETHEKSFLPTLYTFAEALHTIESRAYAVPEMGAIVEQGLRAMVSALDAHSVFLTPSDYTTAIENATGNFAGIGVALRSKERDAKSLEISAVIGGGPAEKSSLQSGDLIVAVDNRPVAGQLTSEVAQKLKGPVGSTISLTIMRNGEARTLTLERQSIIEETVKGSYYPEENILMLTISSFTNHTARQIETLSASHPTASGIIIDLRKNPGGILDEAISVLSSILPAGTKIAETRNRSGAVVREYVTYEKPRLIAAETPIIILTDSLTASCAEIFTGALQYYARKNLASVFVIGEETFGKGSVQEVIPLSHNYGMKLTTQLYFLPDGRSLQGTGITPDCSIAPRQQLSVSVRTLKKITDKERAIHNHIAYNKIVAPPLNNSDDTAPDLAVQTALSAHRLAHFIKKATPHVSPQTLRTTLSELMIGDTPQKSTPVPAR